MLRSMHQAAILALTAWLTGIPALADEVVVFAAASLRSALDPIAQSFQAKTGHSVRISYAGSNALARQILQGAPAAVFISASEKWMDEVETGGELVAGSRRDLLSNRLVVVASEPLSESLNLASGGNLVEVLGDEKLAMAFVDSVPAGQYGKQALESLGQWDSVKDHVVQSDNVRAALAFVSSGEARLGIVYATDAVVEPRVHVVGQFADTTHDPIVYPAALTRQANGDVDRQFFKALTDESADKVFSAQGFTVLD